jgi:hypothetical protein
VRRQLKRRYVLAFFEKLSPCLDCRPLLWSSSPVGARCEPCKDYRRPSAYGCRRHHAARAEAAASFSLDFANRHHIRIFGGILGGIAAMQGPLVFIFLLAKGLRGKAFTKETSQYLVVSASLLAILLTASRQFNWLDVLVSTVRCCQSRSACTSDNVCAIKLHLRHSRSWY